MSKKGEKCKSCGAHCAFEITLLQTIMLTLLLVCAFSPRVQSIPRGPLIWQCLAMTEYFVRKRKSFVCLQKMAWLTYAFYFTPCNALYLSLRLSQSMSDISSRTMQRNFKRHSVSDTVRSRVSIVATDRARFVSSMTLSRESSINHFMIKRRTPCNTQCFENDVISSVAWQSPGRVTE